MKEKVLVYIKKNYFLLLTIVILSVASILRFYNYENRLVFGYDQVYGQLIARHAITSFSLPLLGPFSSAGPFQTGGEWFWFIMLGTLFNLNSYLSPWIFLTVTYVIFVFLMIIFGKELVSKKFGLITGMLAAVSGGQIIQSVNLTNQSPIAIISLLSLWSAVRYVRNRKLRYLFGVGFLPGLAMSIHLQGALLFLMIPALFIWHRKIQIKGILLIILGALLPVLPILISDLNHDFFNIKNMFYYYFLEKNKVSYDVLGRRWLTYIISYIPETWAYIIGGNKIWGYILIALSAFIFGFKVIKRKISKETLIILTGFVFMIILLRYTRTPLFESYSVFLHPYVLIISGLVIYESGKWNRILGVVVLAVVTMTSLVFISSRLGGGTNFELDHARTWKNELVAKYPDKKFAFYNFQNRDPIRSLILSLLLDTENRIDDNGLKIGLTNEILIDKKYDILLEIDKYYRFVNLERASKDYMENNYYFYNPSGVYHSNQEWFKK